MTIVVIQCAASKVPSAGYMLTTDGRPVTFVADPRTAPKRPGIVYARPDDVSDDGKVSWRTRVAAYAKNPGDNAVGLLPAYMLYQPETYLRLVRAFDLSNVYVLSAGWGIISADFLTPSYDITFSRPPGAKDRYKWRRPEDRYEDFCQLPRTSADRIVFLGGVKYLPAFERLTRNIEADKVIYYRAATIQRRQGFRYVPYDTDRLTNWHYSCADDLIAGRI